MSLQITRRSSGILIALAFCMAMQMTGYVLILPLFARRFESFGAGVAALAMSDTAYALTCTIAAPFIGMLADRFGRRPIILLSLAAYILVFSGYLFATSAWLFILIRALAGAFTAGLIPAMMSIVGDLAPQQRRAQWIGIVMGGASAGWVIGPILGGVLYDRFGYVVPFVTSIFMAVVALLLALFLIPETRPSASLSTHLRLPWKRGLQLPPARMTFLILLIITFGVMFAWAFVGPQFMFYAYDDLGWTSSRLGWVMSAFGAAFMLGELTLGQLSDRLGRKPILVLGLALFAAQFVGLVFFRDAIWIAACYLLAGLGNALYDPALTATILDITPAEHTGGMIGLKGTASSLGNMLGPGFLALIAPFTSPQIVFLVATAIVSLFTLVSGFALSGRKSGKVSYPYPTPIIEP